MPTFAGNQNKGMQNLLEQAHNLLRKNQYEEAAKIYRKVLQKEPNSIIALTGASTAYIKTNRFVEAVELLDRALRITPENAQLFSDRGVAYFLNSQINQALSDMDMAQELEPENAYRYSSRAFIRDKAGDTKGAMEDYQKAIALDPEDAVSYNNLGLIQEKMGYKENAKKNYAKADALGGGNPIPEIKKEGKEKSKKIQSPVFSKEKKNKPELNFSYYRMIARSVLTTKKGFREFMNFLMNRGEK